MTACQYNSDSVGSGSLVDSRRGTTTAIAAITLPPTPSLLETTMGSERGSYKQLSSSTSCLNNSIGDVIAVMVEKRNAGAHRYDLRIFITDRVLILISHPNNPRRNPYLAAADLTRVNKNEGIKGNNVMNLYIRVID